MIVVFLIAYPPFAFGRHSGPMSVECSTVSGLDQERHFGDDV